jgi:hypothetical protein
VTTERTSRSSVGYRFEELKSNDRVTIYLRRADNLTKRIDYIADGLASLPDGTVIDGQLVAFDEEGWRNFNLLQNFRSAAAASLQISLVALMLVLDGGEHADEAVPVSLSRSHGDGLESVDAHPVVRIVNDCALVLDRKLVHDLRIVLVRDRLGREQDGQVNVVSTDQRRNCAVKSAHEVHSSYSAGSAGLPLGR